MAGICQHGKRIGACKQCDTEAAARPRSMRPEEREAVRRLMRELAPRKAELIADLGDPNDPDVQRAATVLLAWEQLEQGGFPKEQARELVRDLFAGTPRGADEMLIAGRRRKGK